MRHLIFCIMLLMLGELSHAQQTTQPVIKTSHDFLAKSKKQKRTGEIVLGVGAGLMFAAAVIPRGKLTQEGTPGYGLYFTDQYKNDDLRAALFVGGILSALGSIPFFVVAKKNKKRAAALSFNIEETPLLNGQHLTSAFNPALCVKVNL